MMSAMIKRIPTIVKIVAAVLTPILLSVLAFYTYGIQIRNAESIYPNISIAGIDVSGFTRQEAIESLGLPEYEKRSANAKVTIFFPDDSQLVLTGNDVMLQHNAREIVGDAYFIGHESGVMRDAIFYIQRQKADEISYNIEFALDEEVLRNIVSAVTDEYNIRLDACIPRIYDDHIVFTKGAGHVNADALELTDLAYIGIFESLEIGEPVEIIYALPESTEFIQDILEIRDTVYVQVESSEYDIVTNSATECAVGVTFDTVEAARIVSETKTGKTASFELIYTHPEYTQEHLQSLLFRDIFGRRRTYVGGTANRVFNVELASKAINGLVLLPGEEFSFNEVVGLRTYEAGFKNAPVIANGEVVPGIGGGVCQVSSTLYAAIKPSELLVTERRAHGLPISYLPWGWDATVADGFIDFRFVNNTNYPIHIEIKLEDRNLTAKVYGTIIDDFPVNEGWYLEESWYLEEHTEET